MMLKLAEFIGFILLISLSLYMMLIAHYRHQLVSRRRALWGLAWIGLILAANRMMLLLEVISLEIVISYTGITVSGIVYWVISETKRNMK